MASHNAGVTVVILGLARNSGKTRRLFYLDEFGQETVKEVVNINPYLVASSNVIVDSRSKPLSKLAEMNFGNMPNDGGHLILDAEQGRTAIKEHGVRPDIIRPFLGSHEFIHGISRRCIWMEREAPINLNATWLNNRFARIAETRAQSSRETTRKLAKEPHRFGEVRQAGNETVVIVPIHTSESRDFLPVGLLPPGTIISNAAYGLYGAQAWNLSLIASRLHLVWIATVCGKIKTDYRYSNTLGWNTFPVPPLTDENIANLTRCAENILLAREAHWPATIAELYDPETMPDDLRSAHDRNEETLERIYIGRRFKNDTERLETLFQLYTEMVAKEKGK